TIGRRRHIARGTRSPTPHDGHASFFMWSALCPVKGLSYGLDPSEPQGSSRDRFGRDRRRPCAVRGLRLGSVHVSHCPVKVIDCRLPLWPRFAVTRLRIPCWYLYEARYRMAGGCLDQSAKYYFVFESCEI